MEIQYGNDIFSLSFHPLKNVLYSGLLDGSVNCVSIDDDNSDFRSGWTIQDSKAEISCRCVRPNFDGSSVYAAYQDSHVSVIDSELGAVTSNLADLHVSPISVLCAMNDCLFATGDDDGSVRVWDSRSPASSVPVVSWDNVHEDYISDLLFMQHKKSFVATCADGHLSLLDLRIPKKAKAVSEQQDDELLCVAAVKNYKKIVVGTGEGALSIFSYGQWQDSSDRFPGHPSSVNAIVKIDEDTIATGSADGLVRVLNILPNKLIGAIGDHGDMPVESLAVNSSTSLIASSGHDGKVKLWNLGKDEDVSHADVSLADDVKLSQRKASKGKLSSWSVTLKPTVIAKTSKKAQEKKQKLKKGLVVDKVSKQSIKDFFNDL